MDKDNTQRVPEDINSHCQHRDRKQLVEKQNDFKNQVHSILDQQGIPYDWGPFSQEGREILAPPSERVNGIVSSVKSS